MMELDQRAREKPLAYKVKGTSRESGSQKSTNVIESDLRTHWSTGTNTKEWILLELEEPCLLSHLRIYNKSVSEWEIGICLRYKPETLLKIRPRCDAPRRDMIYPMNYTPCRYVRISCLRGNPIAIFFIQLIGVSVIGLEPEFQPVYNYLLPKIISHKQDTYDINLQLLQDVTSRLLVFLPQIETDLINFSESAESNMQFLAMLVGPFYPILHIVKERKIERSSVHSTDSSTSSNKHLSNLSVSSNFEVQHRRSRSPSPLAQPASCSIAFRLELVFTLLRTAFKDSNLGTVCRVASRALHKLLETASFSSDLIPSGDLAASPDNDDDDKIESHCHIDLNDYSSLFGEEFKMHDNHQDVSYMNLLDAASVEEAVLHVLYACVSQPHLCHKLSDDDSDFCSVLPLLQALRPALYPSLGSFPDGPNQVDDSFSQWNNPSVQYALSQIISCSSSEAFRSLLQASAVYLTSCQPSHVKAACVLIDLCSGPFSSWTFTVIAKIDLAIDLLEDLVGVIQCSSQYVACARAALKYIVLALSGYMDDILPKYKEFKHKLLFLVEMLDPFLNPAITATKSTTAIGDASTLFLEKQEQVCAVTLDIIRSAVLRPAVLSSLESVWRRGYVAPSVLLSILVPQLPLPPQIDLCKCTISKVIEQDSTSDSSGFLVQHHESSPISSCNDESDRKHDSTEAIVIDANMLFVPPELRNTSLVSSNVVEQISADKDSFGEKFLGNQIQNCLNLNSVSSVDYFNVQANYFQLVNMEDCESRSSEFQCVALDLHSHNEISPEGHEAAIDAFLLAAECYINPFFLICFKSLPMLGAQTNSCGSVTKIYLKDDVIEMAKDFKTNIKDIESVPHLERKRDKIVLEILLQAAKLDRKYQKNASEDCQFETEDNRDTIISEIDMQFADAVTLVRQNQALLCSFLAQRLLGERQTLHEVLLQSLLFYLQSATELHCSPENIIDIILKSAENLNALLTSFYHQLKDNNGMLDLEKLHGVQRHWMLLRRLVIVCSGSDVESGPKNVSYGFQYGSLIPLQSWIHKIPMFSTSSFPLTRFLGWMAISHYADQYLKDRLFLAFELCQLSSLLSIFSDELVIVDNIVNKKAKSPGLEFSEGKPHEMELECQSLPNMQGSFLVHHPDLQKFLPDMNLQFQTFGEIILEAVAKQLKSLPSFAVSDALCWFSEFCLSLPVVSEKENVSVANFLNLPRAYSDKSAKAIVLYLIQAIVSEHMEMMVPEMPRIAQVMVSLCKASYCDVAFLDSILHMLNPLISYALTKVSTDAHEYETLCFEEFFNTIKCKNRSDDGSVEKIHKVPLIIFTLGTLFPDLSLLRKQEILQSLSLWTDFTSSEPSTLYGDYLTAFQRVVDSCNKVMVDSLEGFGIKIPGYEAQLNVRTMFILEENLSHPSSNSGNVQLLFLEPKVSEGNHDGVGVSSQCVSHLSLKNIDFTNSFGEFFPKLYPAIEFCWKLHFQSALKLTVASSKCCMLSICLTSVGHLVSDIDHSDVNPNDEVLSGFSNWKASLEVLTVTILAVQQNHCWNVASAMLDYLLGLPGGFSLNCIVSNICSVLKNFCCHAPRISWRLQTDKWLTSLCSRDIGHLTKEIFSLGDLFCTMLGHSEPEQRCIALQQLGRLVGLDINHKLPKPSYIVNQDFSSSHKVFSTSETTTTNLVSSTWDKVAALASCDPLLLLRANSMVLLSGYVPFADRSQIQTFLVAADRILPSLGTHIYQVQMPVVRLSLCLLAYACLYSPTEDISLIPENVWRNLHSMRTSRSVLGVFEKKMCQALSELREEVGGGKEELKESLSLSSSAKQEDPEFRCIRESILQVFSSLTSFDSYFNFFSKKLDQETLEMEEAEIEIELRQKENALLESSERSQEAPPLFFPYQLEGNDRLSKLKNEIRDLEKFKLKEEIAVRREKKLLARHTRQKYLNEAALREMELLQELDRERTIEAERGIERQKLLDNERAKTNELRHLLDLEREKQTQRDLQRELEQVEFRVQPPRREFSSSNPSGRVKERYRENRRTVIRNIPSDGAGGSSNAAISSNTSTVPGSRILTNQPVTILQPRDRSVDVYQDGFDSNRDSCETGSIGETDTVGTQSSSIGRPRQQVIDRREFEGRREGKWERKLS